MIAARLKTAQGIFAVQKGDIHVYIAVSLDFVSKARALLCTGIATKLKQLDLNGDGECVRVIASVHAS